MVESHPGVYGVSRTLSQLRILIESRVIQRHSWAMRLTRISAFRYEVAIGRVWPSNRRNAQLPNQWLNPLRATMIGSSVSSEVTTMTASHAEISRSLNSLAGNAATQFCCLAARGATLLFCVAEFIAEIAMTPRPAES